MHDSLRYRTIRQEQFTEQNCFSVLECRHQGKRLDYSRRWSVQRVDDRSCIHTPPRNSVRGLLAAHREFGATRSSSRMCFSSIPQRVERTEDCKFYVLINGITGPAQG